MGISNGLRRQKDIEFSYVFPQTVRQHTIQATIDGISFYGYYCHRKNGTGYIIDCRNEEKLRQIIDQINPDIIHIFGTELQHTVECIHAVQDVKNIVVSIQGLVSEYEKHYLNGIPLRDVLDVKTYFSTGDSILKGKYQFYRQGLNEKEALKKVRYVIGRTEWDRECVKRVNPNGRYFYCSETLRDIFYGGQWDIQNAERHSIFVSQGNYPIKGLHTLLYALPYLLKKYPDTKVCVAGDNTFLDATAYGIYIRKIIRKTGTEKAVRFMGFLNEEKMFEKMQKSHVMVMPSNCENSPNSVGEAMLVGLPVIVSDVGGVSSVAHDRRDALLFKSCDYKKLAKCICTVFGNDALAKRLSANGKKTAEKLYDRSNNLAMLMGIYQKIYHNQCE